MSGVESSVSAADFKLGWFFTKLTMKEVRDSIDSSRSFLSNADSDPCPGICSGGQVAFVKRFTDIFIARINRKRGEISQLSCFLDAASHGLPSGADDESYEAVLSDSAHLPTSRQ